MDLMCGGEGRGREEPGRETPQQGMNGLVNFQDLDWMDFPDEFLQDNTSQVCL